MINRQKILLLGISILLLVLSGCTSEISGENTPQESISEITINFESVTHKRSDLSLRMYKALAATHNGVAYEIEEACFHAEAEAKELVVNIDADIEEVMNYFAGLDVYTPAILIVTKDIMDGQDLLQSYHYDNTVITTIEHVNNKEYMHALIGAMLDNNIPWINYGIAGQLNNRSIDEDEIMAYLSTDNNIEVLDFFGARFYETIPGSNLDKMIFVTEEFVDYYITAYGKDAFLSYITNENMPDLVKEKNEWLSHLGLEQDYSDDNNIVFQNFRFSRYPNYDFQIYSPYAIYRIKMNTGDEYVFSSIDRIVYLLTKNILAIREVKALFASALSDKSLIEFDTVPLYNINEAERPLKVCANSENNIIMIHIPLFEYAHIHEYVHTITPVDITKKRDYKIDDEYSYFVEGIACYITSSVNNEYSCNYTDFDTYENYNTYQVWTEKIYRYESDIIGSFDEQNQFFVTKYLEYYTSHANDLIEFTDFSMKLYSDSLSYALIEMLGKYPSTQIKNYNYYALYESFVGYLADEYSLEQVIQALDNYDEIEAIFGKSFNELHDEWKAYLFES